MGRSDFQTGLRRRAANEAQQDQQCAQNMARPGGGDLTEKSVLDRIPFRTSRRVVADADL